MELCTSQAISKLPTHNNLLTQNPNTNLHSSNSSLLTLRRSPPLPAALRLRSGSLCSSRFLTRATSSDETSSGASEYGGKEREAVATLDLENVPSFFATTSEPEVTKEEPPVYEKDPEPEVTKEELPVYEKDPEPEVTKEEPLVYAKSVEVTEGESSGDEPFSITEFLEKLNINTDDKYSLALYGSGALFSLWLGSAVVGAIDSIPLFPKLMELVGLGYSFWFTYRYLLFKNTREELYTKFEELKGEVIGSADD